MVEILYTAKNEQVATSLFESCNILLQQVFCKLQWTCCKAIVKTSYPQACCRLFQQVVTSLQIRRCNEPDFNKFVVTW